MVDAAIISGLLTNLAPLARNEFSLLWNFREEVQTLTNRLSSINVILEDAERMVVREEDKQMEDWLRKLKPVAYEVRDIMDEWTFEDLHLQVKRRKAFSSMRIQVTNSITLPFSKTWTLGKISYNIKHIMEKLDQIISSGCNLQLQSDYDSCPPIPREKVFGREGEKEENVFGREMEAQRIIDILVRSSNVANDVSVLPIIGFGGLGKTTLAQLVFNSEVISKHFDVKFWVCVPDEFDIKLIMKAIIGTTDEIPLEGLQTMIEDILKGKRYLLVLDDVWNENYEKWEKLRSILNCGSNGAFILTTTRNRIVAKNMETIETFELSPLSDDYCWSLLKDRAFFYGIVPRTSKFTSIGKEIAYKCMGIPLLAKTLGGQLGFKNDEKEWRRIRDKMWQISENEELSVLSILKLSYYGLPHYLRRCFAFCAIFPKDVEIEKERMIQLWMANDLIPYKITQELEDTGSLIWDELCWRSFFQEEKLDWIGVKRTCKLHDHMHDLAKHFMKDECYTLNGRSSSKDFGQEIRHVTIMVNDFNEELLLRSLHLQSIIFHSTVSNTDPNKIVSVLKKHSSLRVLDVCLNIQNLDLRYMGCLKHLKCLNLSSSKVKTLPISICDLLNLQTLNLNHCEYLKSLPRNTKYLVNLRHLCLEGCLRLKCMPQGMNQLRVLKTLSLFVMGKRNRDCKLDELEELNIRGSLKIKHLERVSDASIASGRFGFALQKSSINLLELEWNEDDNNENRHEKIGETLNVPTSCLKILKMRGYKGVNIPKWVGYSSSSLTYLHLEEMDNVLHLFTINDMNTGCSSGDNGMVVFPLLEKLEVHKMMNLIELVSPPMLISSDGSAFSKLCRIVINNCPRLGALPPQLKSLNDVSVGGECSDELLNSLSILSALTNLNLSGMDERSVLFSAASSCRDDVKGMEVLFPVLENLFISNMNNLRALVSDPTTPVFPNLNTLKIFYCKNLGWLSPLHFQSLKEATLWGDCSDLLLYSISNLNALTHLTLSLMNERSVLFSSKTFEEIGKEIDMKGQGQQSTFQSLQTLDISWFHQLSYLFDEGMHLPSLQILRIDQCRKLKSLCQQCLHCPRGELRNRTGGGISNLHSLTIWDCSKLMISPEQLRNFRHSLQDLRISHCPKLLPLKEEEADIIIALLQSLRNKLGPDNFTVDILKEEEDRRAASVAI